MVQSPVTVLVVTVPMLRVPQPDARQVPDLSGPAVSCRVPDFRRPARRGRGSGLRERATGVSGTGPGMTGPDHCGIAGLCSGIAVPSGAAATCRNAGHGASVRQWEPCRSPHGYSHPRIAHFSGCPLHAGFPVVARISSPQWLVQALRRSRWHCLCLTVRAAGRLSYLPGHSANQRPPARPAGACGTPLYRRSILAAVGVVLLLALRARRDRRIEAAKKSGDNRTIRLIPESAKDIPRACRRYPDYLDAASAVALGL
jgi:hypothetical protein